MKKNDEQVFDHYCRLLYKISVIMLCNEQDALDAVQETFFKSHDESIKIARSVAIQLHKIYEAGRSQSGPTLTI